MFVLGVTASAFTSASAVPASAAPGIQFMQASSGMLAKLRVAPEVQGNTYERTYFGGWSDTDGDRCNTRKEVLLAEATTPVTVTGSCTLQGGSWQSPYDNAQTSISGTYDIDHMVPLKEAWVSGAYGWSSRTLRNFANDLGYAHSLIAVTASSNRQKSDQDPATWLPSNSSFVCQYVGRWIAVKYRWSLAIDTAEKSVLSSAVSSCGAGAEVSEPALAEIVAGSVAGAQPIGGVDAQPGASTEGASTNSPTFANCSALNAVFAGGVASSPQSVNLAKGVARATKNPLTVDANVYAVNARLDRDKDGVACEK